jgi:hypothetical protein
LRLLIFSLLALTVFSCTKDDKPGKPDGEIQVIQYNVNNLISNSWCEINTQASTLSTKWIFSKDYVATSIDLQSGLKKGYSWTITAANILYVKRGSTLLFTRKISYDYNDSAQQRMMTWFEPESGQQSCNEQGQCVIVAPSVKAQFTECQ